MAQTNIEEARIVIEAAAVALEGPNPDIDAVRQMLAEADKLLAKAMNPSG
jgi:hypothetical protein